jgi:hypothetical protein
MPQDSPTALKHQSKPKALTSLLQARQNSTPIPPGMQEKMAAVSVSHLGPPQALISC